MPQHCTFVVICKTNYFKANIMIVKGVSTTVVFFKFFPVQVYTITIGSA